MAKITKISNEKIQPGRRTGKAPTKGHPKLLNFADFLRQEVEIPAASNYWKRKAKFPKRHFGNVLKGSCTRSSQAQNIMRLERKEQRRNVIITDDEVLRVYEEMTCRHYGCGDTGAYELDALSEWRKPDLTIRDTKGRPYTIDAFTAINHRSIEQMKKAIWLGGGNGVKVCFNLPWAWAGIEDEQMIWDVEDGLEMVGDWMPGSWGGHSMYGYDFDPNWLYLTHTWDCPDGKISWRAFAAYCDEAYFVIDSINAWKKRKAAKILHLPKLVSAVNEISSQKIRA
jgi:hypothetical protein